MGFACGIETPAIAMSLCADATNAAFTVPACNGRFDDWLADFLNAVALRPSVVLAFAP